MTQGLTKSELEARGKDSLIRYIGILQAHLQAVYDAQLTDQNAEIGEGVDFPDGVALKLRA